MYYFHNVLTDCSQNMFVIVGGLNDVLISVTIVYLFVSRLALLVKLIAGPKKENGEKVQANYNNF